MPLVKAHFFDPWCNDGTSIFTILSVLVLTPSFRVKCVEVMKIYVCVELNVRILQVVCYIEQLWLGLVICLGMPLMLAFPCYIA